MSKTTERYFEILKDYFRDLIDWGSKRGHSRLGLVRAVAELYDPNLMKTMMESLQQELTNLNWTSQENAEVKLGGLKTAYLGHAYIWQVSPTETFDFLKKMGLYSDTIIINDPILSELLHWQKRGSGEAVSFNLVAQYALSLLTIEDLFSLELDPPICILGPSELYSFKRRNIYDEAERYLGKDFIVSYASELFGESFVSYEEVLSFLSKVGDFNEFVSLIQKPEIFTGLHGEPVREQNFQNVKEYYSAKYNTSFSSTDSFYLVLRGRYGMVAHDLILNGNVTSDFVTDFKGMWNGLIWLLRKDNELAFSHLEMPQISKDALIMNALQGKELKWLGNVPLAKLKALRQRGELQELRDIIGGNVEEMMNVGDEEFVEVGRLVRYNLGEAFKRHDSDVKDLNEKYKRRYDIDVASIAVSGSLGVVSALLPPLALAAGTASSILGSGSILKMINDYVKKREQLEALQKKPVAMLFDVHKSVT